MREQSPGVCENCQEAFGYYLIHSGFNDSSYAYCDACGKAAVLSLLRAAQINSLPKGPQCMEFKEIFSEWEQYLQPCACGARFRKGAMPRCPTCKLPLSAELAAEYIEAHAPGTKSGWRWQRNWAGMYCIVIANQYVTDNFVL